MFLFCSHEQKNKKSVQKQKKETQTNRGLRLGKKKERMESLEVTVDTLDRGFRINVYSERNCPGLLVSILEDFEELGLNVLDARVSCSDNFHFEAVGGEDHGDGMDAQVVKQAVLEAIKSWSERNE
ncbi:hypothetical protein ACJRO7_007063 [Eucalyptus globulus]|uniref:Plant bHLH transcription factor ACT-like domain-containing protein n=1 Tax=Eucalyptus globulus TaxID=34317 RepID=A0ABD3IMV0_EUCGL